MLTNVRTVQLASATVTSRSDLVGNHEWSRKKRNTELRQPGSVRDVQGGQKTVTNTAGKGGRPGSPLGGAFRLRVGNYLA